MACNDCDNPHTFEEAVAYLAEGNYIDYEVKIDTHQGALMTRETWLESVEEKSFIDYDGMGNEIAEDGTVLESQNRWIKPSQADRIRPETKYILWYNR